MASHADLGVGGSAIKISFPNMAEANGYSRVGLGRDGGEEQLSTRNKRISLLVNTAKRFSRP